MSRLFWLAVGAVIGVVAVICLVVWAGWQKVKGQKSDK